MTAKVHMIGTQKAWDAIDDNGCLNGMMIMGSGELKPKTFILPDITDTALMSMMYDLSLEHLPEDV